VATNAELNGKYNVAFQASYLIGNADRCVQILIKSKRIAEAAFFARAYCPSQITQVVKAWDETLKAKKLPFEPENITSPSHPQNQIVEMALGIEKQIKAILTSDRPSAEHYEQALQDYFRDLSIPASVEEEEQ
jgi:coatomer subunit beta'